MMYTQYLPTLHGGLESKKTTRQPKVVVLAIGSAALLSSVGLSTPSTAQAESACSIPNTIRLSDLSTISTSCSYKVSAIELPDGRQFPIPDPGYSVTLHTLVVEGEDSANDVSIDRSRSGEVTVLLGDAIAQAEIESRMNSSSTRASCTDSYNLLGFSWAGSYGWKYNSENQPSSSALDQLQAGGSRWGGFMSVCNTTLRSNATSKYQGTTSDTPLVNADLTCGFSIGGQSIVGFGPLPTGTLAATCTWRLLSLPVKSDQKYNSNYSWNVSLGCSGNVYDLRGVATHEMGHSFGLGHVDQSSGLVMKPASGPCETGQRDLGYGDALGIAALYP